MNTGHGGLMDRMDCQLLMMAFTSFHYRSPYLPLCYINYFYRLFTVIKNSTYSCSHVHFTFPLFFHFISFYFSS